MRRSLTATVDHPAHALYTLAVTSGMRAGELLGLQWGDIDLDAGKLTVQRALQQQNSAGLVFVTPKTAKSRRMILFSQRAIDALRAHRDRQTFHRKQVGAGWRDLDLVFPGPFGGPTDPSWSRQVFYAALETAGIPRVRFHDLRHTAATLALMQGVHPKVVSDMLGHSTVGLTLDTYSHLLPAMHQRRQRRWMRSLQGRFSLCISTVGKMPAAHRSRFWMTRIGVELDLDSFIRKFEP